MRLAPSYSLITALVGAAVLCAGCAGVTPLNDPTGMQAAVADAQRAAQAAVDAAQAAAATHLQAQQAMEAGARLAAEGAALMAAQASMPIIPPQPPELHER